MPAIFKAKTNHSYAIKVLADLLQNNIKTACFVIDSKTIMLRMMTIEKTLLFDLKLDSKRFNTYKFRSKDKLYIGFNLFHFFEMIRSIKKKDTIQLAIYEENPSSLEIKVIPEKNNKVTTSIIKIQTTQNVHIEVPTQYKYNVIVPSADYQKLCKSMSNLGDLIQIVTKDNYICFKSQNGELIKRNVEFGNIEDSDDEDAEEPTNTQIFDVCRLINTSKLSGLSKELSIYSGPKMPIKIDVGIATLGRLSIFIKEKVMDS